MRAMRYIVTVLFIVIIAFSVYVKLTDNKDYSGPTLVCDSEEYKLSVKDSPDTLLKHVKATDSRDGDISSSVVIENISSFIDNTHNAKITFAVADSDNNVSKITKDVIYTDYTEPKFKMSSQLTFYTGALKADLTSPITATDVLDGDLTSKLVIIDSTLDLAKPGTYPVKYRVTTSKGVNTELTVNAYVYDERLSGNIQLSDYLVYTKINQKVDAQKLIKDYTKSSSFNLDIIDEVDYKKAGTYYITYRLIQPVEDTDDSNNTADKIVAEAYLAVIVEES